MSHSPDAPREELAMETLGDWFQFLQKPWRRVLYALGSDIHLF